MEYSAPDEFMVVYFPEHQSDGSSLAEWPRHAGIVPWMRGNLDSNEAIIETHLAGEERFNATVGKQLFLGPSANIPAWLLEPRDRIASIHEYLASHMEGQLVDVSEREHMGENYLPHVTLKPHQLPLVLGETLVVNSLAIVVKHLGKRSIYRNIELGTARNG